MMKVKAATIYLVPPIAQQLLLLGAPAWYLLDAASSAAVCLLLMPVIDIFLLSCPWLKMLRVVDANMGVHQPGCPRFFCSLLVGS